ASPGRSSQHWPSPLRWPACRSRERSSDCPLCAARRTTWAASSSTTIRKDRAAVALKYEDIAEIIRIINASSCDGLDPEPAELHLVVRRQGGTSEPTAPATPALAPAPSLPAPARVSAAAPSPALPKGRVLVRAPMVGTFYAAPSPEAALFVAVGSVV